MAGNMSTLHEICVEYANKQPGMVDALTEEAPVLTRCKWTPATHSMWNVAEKVTDIEGASFVEPDAPLPRMSASTDLVTTDLFTLGGTMEVPSQRAKKMGGPAKYFAQRQDLLLKHAGMTTETALVLNNWLKGAKAEKNLRNAGGKSAGWFLLAVRFDDLSNVGLYDPDQWTSGRFFNIDLPYGGQEHYLHQPGNEGKLGYSITYRSNFGWQMLDAKRTVSAIVNIDESSHPTPDMIDDMLADVRAQPASTIIICSPRGQIHGINPYKKDHVQLTNNDGAVNTMVQTWSGIPIITSHNFNDKQANVSVKA